jgi:hypothetical protein
VRSFISGHVQHGAGDTHCDTGARTLR